MLQTFSVLWRGLFAPRRELDTHCWNYFHTWIYNILVRLICLISITHSPICSEINLVKDKHILKEYLVKCVFVQEALPRVKNIVSWLGFSIVAATENSSCKCRWRCKVNEALVPKL